MYKIEKVSSLKQMKNVLFLLSVCFGFLSPSCKAPKKIESNSPQKSPAYYFKSLNINAYEPANTKLLAEIDEWIGVPHKMGGTTKKGIDCSGFVGYLHKTIYFHQLERTAKEIHRNNVKKVSSSQAKEGDLVFFKISGKVSHVGLYLSDGIFAHASSSKGVMLSSINETYWKKHLISIGRVKL